jgi:hypothetical protein
MNFEDKAMTMAITNPEYNFPIYLDSYGQGYQRVFNNFLEKVPLTELFDGL